jgi:hypothetical protein
VKIRLLFAWYDLWIGAYWDRKNRTLYVLPLPCIGVVIEFAPRHPERCPVTGLPFFMVIDHYDRGPVPTYGGPLDSYTIPERDKSGEWERERYCHDEGAWVEYEWVPDYTLLPGVTSATQPAQNEPTRG